MRKTLVAGTFDPVTIGHVDIIQRTIALFDEVHVVIFVNPNKKPLFSLSTRQKMLQMALADMASVVIDYSDGMLVDYMQQHGISATIRGVRNAADFDYEFAMAEQNQQLWSECETIILPCAENYAQISSGMIREALHNGQDVSHFLPKAILPLVYDTFQREKI